MLCDSLGGTLVVEIQVVNSNTLFLYFSPCVAGFLNDPFLFFPLLFFSLL